MRSDTVSAGRHSVIYFCFDVEEAPLEVNRVSAGRHSVIYFCKVARRFIASLVKSQQAGILSSTSAHLVLGQLNGRGKSQQASILSSISASPIGPK